MSPYTFLDWATWIGLLMLPFVVAGIVRDALTERRRHDREGD